jgi:tripartite ATP-independent transporter DctP family solute receptor
MSWRLCAWFGVGLAVLSSAPSHAERTFRLGSPWPTNSTPHAGLKTFAETLETESKGQLKILVYPDSQLGDIQSLISSVQTGTVDMTYLSVGNAGVLKGGAPLNVAYVPYLFNSKAAAVETVNSPIFQEMYETLAKEAGVRIFAAYGSRLPRAVNTVKGPLVKPADLKGMKIRVPPIELLRATFDKLGAKPVVMGLGDTYMALSRGQVDGQENGIDALVTYKWYEVTKYVSATDHVYEVAAYYMNEKLWQSLTSQERDLFRRAARAGGEAMTKAGEELDREGMDTMKKAGLTYTVPDRAAFQEALKDIHKPYEGKLWPAGLVERIRAAQH